MNSAGVQKGVKRVKAKVQQPEAQELIYINVPQVLKVLTTKYPLGCKFLHAT